MMDSKVFYLLTCLGLATASAVACTTTTTLVSAIPDDAGASSGDGGGDDDVPSGKDATAGGSLCERYCAQSTKAGCATPSKDECVQDCEDTRDQVPSSCKKAVDAMLTCSTTATFTCDEDGKATTESCSDESLALLSCLQGGGKDGGGGEPTDGGTDGGSGGACYAPGDAITNTMYTGVGPGNRCTATQIDAVVNGCFAASATDATCTAQKQANPTCFDCFFDSTGNAARPYPVFIAIDDDNALVSFYSCLAAVIGKPECAKSGMDYVICQSSACTTCSDNDYDACLDEADDPGNACSTILGNSCTAAFNAASAADINKCTGADSVERLKNVAKQICTIGASK